MLIEALPLLRTVAGTFFIEYEPITNIYWWLVNFEFIQTLLELISRIVI